MKKRKFDAIGSKFADGDTEESEASQDEAHQTKKWKVDAIGSKFADGDSEESEASQDEAKSPPPCSPEEQIWRVIDGCIRPDGQLHVTPSELSGLKKQYKTEMLANTLCHIIATRSGCRERYVRGQGYPLPYPFKRHFMGSVKPKFDKLCTFPWRQRLVTEPYSVIHGLVSNTWLFPFQFDGKFLRIRSLPEDYEEMDIITDFFTEEPRLRSRRLNSKHCPLDYWTHPELSVGWMTPLLDGTGEKIYDRLCPESLRETMAYAKEVKECTQFKPSLGVAMLSLLEGTRVLDFSSGWGDRLIAAIAAKVKRYVGVDPNPDLQPGYKGIINAFAEFPERYTMLNAPFEKVVLPPNETYDLVFTSPPYFNLELYSCPTNQSAQEDTSITSWLTEFLFPSLKKAWAVLDVEGHIAIHIVDFNRRNGVFTEVMNLYIQGYLPGAVYRGVVCADGGQSSRIRPFWVWRKTSPTPTERSEKAKQAKEETQRHYPEVWNAMQKSSLLQE